MTSTTGAPATGRPAMPSASRSPRPVPVPVRDGYRRPANPLPADHAGAHRTVGPPVDAPKEVRSMSTLLMERREVSARLDDIPCRVDDADLWFAEKPEDVEFAKSLCGTCPMRPDCLSGAMERGEPWGVWGGELFVQGEIVARKRPRGRPRKDAVAA